MGLAKRLSSLTVLAALTVLAGSFPLSTSFVPAFHNGYNNKASSSSCFSPNVRRATSNIVAETINLELQETLMELAHSIDQNNNNNNNNGVAVQESQIAREVYLLTAREQELFNRLVQQEPRGLSVAQSRELQFLRVTNSLLFKFGAVVLLSSGSDVALVGVCWTLLEPTDLLQFVGILHAIQTRVRGGIPVLGLSPKGRIVGAAVGIHIDPDDLETITELSQQHNLLTLDYHGQEFLSYANIATSHHEKERVKIP